MTVSKLCTAEEFELITPPQDREAKITVPYCCDLLSWAMGRAPEGCAWVTVIANQNTLAVAQLTEAACIILAENVRPDEKMKEKALEQGICIMTSPLPAFETALKVYEAINV